MAWVILECQHFQWMNFTSAGLTKDCFHLMGKFYRHELKLFGLGLEFSWSQVLKMRLASLHRSMPTTYFSAWWVNSTSVYSKQHKYNLYTNNNTWQYALRSPCNCLWRIVSFGITHHTSSDILTDIRCTTLVSLAMKTCLRFELSKLTNPWIIPVWYLYMLSHNLLSWKRL